MKPRLIIEQKITAFVNKYKVLEADSNGQAVQFAALAQQKRLAFREKVAFYTDEQKSRVAFTFRAEKVMDIHGRYFVEAADGQLLGMFRKEFKKSLVSSSWVVMDPEGRDVVRVQESDITIAVLRRFVGFVPLVGGLLDLVMNFFKYHFSFVDLSTGHEVGQYRKTTLFRDHYQLLMTDEAWQQLDWRLLAAMSVALDALQSR